MPLGAREFRPPIESTLRAWEHRKLESCRRFAETRRMKPPRPICLVFGLLCLLPDAGGETVKDREGAVRADKAKLESSTRWIYNDVAAGFVEAKRTGKPLMVVLRCVPCLACMGIDTEVLVENPAVTPLMDRFVRVRLINANALDLSRFQFDYDLSFTTLFFNADGTIYGRYGSWEHQRDPQNAATATFAAALEGALKIHAAYPGNKTALAGKQGEPSRYRTPVDMPGLQEKYGPDLNWNGQVVKSCVHCHQIGDAMRLEIRDKRKPLPLSLIYPHPAPETIGIRLDASVPTQIADITPGSPAEGAGLRAGDVFLALSGQPLISAADVSWVLHHAPDSGGRLVALARRGDKTADVEITLPAGWRTNSDISRRVGTWPMRAMAFGGMKLEELPEDERRRLGIPDGKLALFAKHVGQYGKHALAKQKGWKKGDVLLSVDGSDEHRTESQLIGQMIRGHKPGDLVPAEVLRGNQRIELKIPVQ